MHRRKHNAHFGPPLNLGRAVHPDGKRLLLVAAQLGHPLGHAVDPIVSKRDFTGGWGVKLDLQVKERKLARIAPMLVDEPTS